MFRFILLSVIFINYSVLSQITFPNDNSTRATTISSRPSTTIRLSATVTTSTTAATTTRATTKGSTVRTSDNSVCVCVAPDSCTSVLGGNRSVSQNDGGGQIQPRIVNPSREQSIVTGTNDSVTTPISSGIALVSANLSSCPRSILSLCCPGTPYQCGYNYPPISGSLTLPGRSRFGEFPWAALVFTLNSIYIGSAVLIDQNHLLTVPHRFEKYPNASFKVRLGDWDTSNRNEPLPFLEFNVSKIFIHPDYNSLNLHNDIAILRTSSPVPLGALPTIGTACLPANPILPPIRCFVAGWGRSDFFFGSNSPTQRRVDLPLMDHQACEDILKQTALGVNFDLHSGFLCAGGEVGKDACTGDGGAALVCRVQKQWYVQGVAAWGIQCGQNIPGVYMNVSNYIPWIQATTQMP